MRLFGQHTTDSTRWTLLHSRGLSVLPAWKNLTQQIAEEQILLSTNNLQLGSKNLSHMRPRLSVHADAGIGETACVGRYLAYWPYAIIFSSGRQSYSESIFKNSSMMYLGRPRASSKVRQRYSPIMPSITI